MNVAGKVFIVTGASSGIGEELSTKLAQRGASVICAARRRAELERVCASIRSSGGSALAVPTDITEVDQVRHLVKKTIESHGRIEGLVLNAGISMWARFEDISDISFFNDLINTNYLGAVRCCHEALPYLKESHGIIVSCSSAQALMGFSNHSGYVASKHALRGFLSTLAMEHYGEITILEAVLGWIRGTGLRSNAFGPDGAKHAESARKHTSESVGVEECVEKIIRAIELDRATVYVPGKLRLVPFLNIFFKRYLHRKVTRAIDENRNDS